MVALAPLRIVALTLGFSPAELQEKLEVPLLIKRRNVVSLNDVETYFQELRGRVRTHIEAAT